MNNFCNRGMTKLVFFSCVYQFCTVSHFSIIPVFGKLNCTKMDLQEADVETVGILSFQSQEMPRLYIFYASNNEVCVCVCVYYPQYANTIIRNTLLHAAGICLVFVPLQCIFINTPNALKSNHPPSPHTHTQSLHIVSCECLYVCIRCIPA